MINKSAEYSMLNIVVLDLEHDRVKYKLTFSKTNREFFWYASNASDRAIMHRLSIGQQYKVKTYSDARGVQHWTLVEPIGIQPKKHAELKSDQFVEY